MLPHTIITTLLYNKEYIKSLIEIQVLCILCYCCYLFLLFAKWILQTFYDFQRRETLVTNDSGEQPKQVRERNLEENPEVDSVFTNNMDSPVCLQILFNCLRNVEKNVKEIREMQEKIQSSQIKDELQLNKLNEAVEFITKKI